MKKIVAINTSPRSKWNTDLLVKATAEGAQEAGAQVEYFDLYKLDAYQGCRSCFVCKTDRSRGICAIKDSLAPVLAAIREADALVIGSPIYFGRPTAGFRALFERLCFQYLTYRIDKLTLTERFIPVLFIVTTNCKEEQYPEMGYDRMLEEHKQLFERFVGPTTIYACTDTLQTDHYERYDWTRFDIEAKQRRREEVFPGELDHMRELGKELVS